MVKYKDALPDLLEHSKKDNHILSGKRVYDFLAYYESGGKIGIDVVLSDHMSQIVEHNRKRLIPIIKTILFCAQNNLALRGHRELGSLSECDVRKECLSGKQGLLRALLSFRIEFGDKDLESHFDTAAKNCTMISPTIQNEIMETIGDITKDKIVNRIKASKYYSILCDETTNISTKEQMTICIRYVDTSSSIIREDFIGFVEMVSTTGISIKETLKNKVEKVGLYFDDLRGQGYDGGSNISGKYNGVQALILDEQPLAFYTHCFSHSLNLCLSKACEVSSIKNMNASKLEIERRIPRICGRQTARNNVHAKDAEEYYKIVIFIPFLDNLILQLHSRFDKRLETIIPIEGFIPSNLSHYDDQAILPAASIYEDDFLARCI
ncbi:zinc finger MYM-type protein 1-like [Rhopalosiphum padi]|uniref:zinc finger MYM-type protein 1-like n=1 Tax=Rhopalosiphum padi TaxID=40932 RepID=UPI00298D6CBE|nr:zinc finger MYM-type protein 1-like [Rhopalosiphum padi]